jgi:hypothetical protein
MPLLKYVALGTSSLLGLALTAMMPAEPLTGPDEPPKAKKKDEPGTGDEMKKAYDLLRRIRSDNRTSGRPEERLKDWTERATKLYRQALKAADDGNEHKAREYGVAAHDLARAVDHARNAASVATDLDDELPPPPEAKHHEDEDERTRHDLRHAYDRISELKDDAEGLETAFYLDASKDLYNAARRDAVAGRHERAGELARAAEALTHVPEHLARALEDRPEPKEKKAKKDRPEPPKAKEGRPEPKEKKEKKDRPEPKEKKDRPGPAGEIPPPID